jgi:hypothetical protein
MNKSTSNTDHQRLGRLSLATFGLLSRSLSSLRCLIALVIAHAPLVEVHPDVVRVNDCRRSDGRHKFPVLGNGSVAAATVVVVGSYEGIIMNPKGWCALAGITIALMVAVLLVVRAAADVWDTCEKASGDAAIATCTPGDLACPGGAPSR